MFSLGQNQSGEKLPRELRGSGPPKGEKGENMNTVNKKNFERLFVIKSKSCYVYTDEQNITIFKISLDVEDFLSIRWKRGRYMYTGEIIEALMRFIKEYETEFETKITPFRRQNLYRFCYREGTSGCRECFIEYKKDDDGFPERKSILYETCFGKTAGVNCFLYDFMDLCVALGSMEIKGGTYSCPANDNIESIEVIKPRLIQFENGWTWGEVRPNSLVPLAVCREQPSD